MAWLDDRVWCSPKFADLSDGAYRIWTHSLMYSAGFGTKGVLTPGQQSLIGSSARVRKTLISFKLWDELEDGNVRVHDWDRHNDKRDARRAYDRERKQRERDRNKKENPQDVPQDESGDVPKEQPVVLPSAEGSEEVKNSAAAKNGRSSPPPAAITDLIKRAFGAYVGSGGTHMLAKDRDVLAANVKRLAKKGEDESLILATCRGLALDGKWPGNFPDEFAAVKANNGRCRHHQDTLRCTLKQLDECGCNYCRSSAEYMLGHPDKFEEWQLA